RRWPVPACPNCCARWPGGPPRCWWRCRWPAATCTATPPRRRSPTPGWTRTAWGRRPRPGRSPTGAATCGRDTPGPNGPRFLTPGRLVAMLPRDHVVLTVLVMRLVAVGGLLVTVRYLPRLATACGADPRLAVWLALLNPLVLIHFIGGGHNDLVMLALVVAGVTVAVEARPGAPDAQRRLAAGVVLCTLAMLVKAPALLAIGFLVPVWADRLPGPSRRRWLQAMLRIGVVAAVTFGLATLA